ncbi:MAG: aminotransferase class I/II-fold pyridoxal phosphate-dependent enzyme [Myxococcales bacterium]|nr:aminotransferase class I/II-fold pyridoxal phosphate-dependent enzyme [Myxococcales bacterium]
MIDLRSDTVTQPTPAMRAAMAAAPVGDDVYGEDPSVRELEARIARMLGKPAALFVTSGTMGNQLAIRCSTEPGDEVIVGEGAHPVFHESGAAPVLSGVQFAIAGRGGLFTAEDAEREIKPRAYTSPRTSLICVENTHNRAGGRIFPEAEIERIGAVARANGLAFHLDGARLWNTHVASKLPLARLAAPFDTVSICFSKGLGAPVGSALLGTAALVEKARRFRKMWGGGMRQAGILAAAALYALDHHVERLQEDHDKARALGQKLASVPGLVVDEASIDTNIVNIDVERLAPEAVSAEARARGLLLNPSAPGRLRAVLHLDVRREDIARCAAILAESLEAVRART